MFPIAGIIAAILIAYTIMMVIKFLLPKARFEFMAILIFCLVISVWYKRGLPALPQ
jgi:hypothetical protein